MRTFKRVLALACGVVLVSGAPATADPAPGKERCKKGGYQELGFANQGQCVKAANEAHRNGEPVPPEDDGGGNGGGGGGGPFPT